MKLINETLPPFWSEKVLSFQPHMTITSDVSPDLDPKAVVSDIQVRELPVVKFKSVNLGETHFTKCTLHLEKTDSIMELVTHCRALYVTNGDVQKATQWAQEDFTPHVSLVYADETPVDVIHKIEEEVKKAGIRLSGLDGSMSGWEGGRVWLV